jgi:hypothetical protein
VVRVHPVQMGMSGFGRTAKGNLKQQAVFTGHGRRRLGTGIGLLATAMFSRRLFRPITYMRIHKRGGCILCLPPRLMRIREARTGR